MGRGDKCCNGSDAARTLAGWRKPTPRPLIRDHGAEAYGEARQRERDVTQPDGTTHAGRTPAHWRRIALIVARMTGKRAVQAGGRKKTAQQQRIALLMLHIAKRGDDQPATHERIGLKKQQFGRLKQEAAD